jgi:hypothetical protein
MIHDFDKHDDEDDFGEAIGLLLQHKNDFRVLSFECLRNRFIPMMLPFFRVGYPHLQKRKLSDCGVFGDGLDALIHAMVESSDGKW